MLSAKCFIFFMLMSFVAAYPFRIPAHVHSHPEVDEPALTREISEDSDDRTGPSVNPGNKTGGFRSLQQLYDGNQRFRQKVQVQAERTTQEEPGFMFLGCTDNKLSPSAIFNAPAGSIVTQNNVGNQYSSQDPSAEAAIAYAVESLQVEHIIVLGHYGCQGVETSITMSQKAMSQKANSALRSWIKPIADLYSTSKRVEIVKLRDSRLPRRGQPNGIKEAPPANDAGFRALVEENVKRSVNNLRDHSVLKSAFSKSLKNDQGQDIDVFVHGFVYDEESGDVHDMHVSFGPPGKQIPHIPFKVIAAAKNFQYDSHLPGINRGKTWDFGAH